MKIRGHHLACVYCYLGSGKNSGVDFFGVANSIPELLDLLRSNPDMEITVWDDVDDVCDVCPLRRSRGCGRGKDPVAQNQKLRSWDKEILGRLGLHAGDRTTPRQVEAKMRETIGDIGQICTNCASSAASGWQEFRHGIAKGLWPKE